MRVFSPRANTDMLLGMFPTGTWSLCRTETPTREVSITPTAGCEARMRRSYVFLDAQLLKLDKLGAPGLQVEPPSGLVGDALLAGTHD